MRQAVEILEVAGGAAFLLLALVNVAAWRRTRESRHLLLAIALGSLGAMSWLGRISEEVGFRSQLLTDATIVLLLVSGYSFLRFRGTFVPLARRRHRAAAAAVMLSGTVAIAVALPGGPDAMYSPGQTAALLGLLVVWSACMFEPVVGFWVSARSLPPVQRSRLRALSVGYASVVTIILGLTAFSPAARRPTVTIIGYGLGLAMVPLIYVSFAPPRWLRRIWRRHEEDALMRAMSDLVRFAADRPALGGRALHWATRLLGTDAGFIGDGNGAIIASVGLSEVSVARLSAHLEPRDGAYLTRLADGRHAVVASLESSEGAGVVAVISGPYTPLFGSDEVTRVAQLAAVIGPGLERVRLSEALRAETVRYETLLDTVSDVGEGVVVAEGLSLVYANEAYERITGYTIEELRGLGSLMELAPEDVRAELIERYRLRRAGTEVPEHYETALIRKDGRRVEVEVALKLLDRGPEPSQVISIIRDITQRVLAERALRSSREQLAEAQAVAGLGSWEWDVSTGALTWSAEMCRIFGEAPETCRPTYETFIERIHPEDRTLVEETIGEALLGGRPYSLDHRIVLPSGEVRILAGKGEVDVNEHGEPTRLFGTGQDVTDRARAEDALRQAYEREREAAEQLRSLDAMKNAFLTAVSHELRTPLTAVLGFAKTLEHQSERISPDEQRAFLGRLGANADKLDRLLSDLLDVDRLSRGLVEPVRRPVDIGELILRVAGESPSLPSRPIQVDAGSLTISVDGPKVERIIENLLANAARHTPPGTPIWIRAGEFERGVLIAVEDAGQGVSPDLREALFEPFQQGPGVPDHAPGVGIGLSLVARFAELHGGRAWVEDRPGGGASFRVYLPGALEPLLHSPS